MLRLLCAAALMIALPAMAQVSMPPPSNPVVFCGQQSPPAADSYELIFDGGAPEALTMDAVLSTLCAAGKTHSFRLPPSRFTVGVHTLQARAANTFGSTDGPIYTLTVGIAPGPFSIELAAGFELRVELSGDGRIEVRRTLVAYPYT